MELKFEVSTNSTSFMSTLYGQEKVYRFHNRKNSRLPKNFIIGITEFVLKYLRSDRIFHYKNSTSTAEKKKYKINLLKL